jgi:hypothetical protein
MITALVLLPLVISISSPLFLPSWMVRLVGAEFGETMATTLFMANILPNPICTGSMLIIITSKIILTKYSVD